MAFSSPSFLFLFLPFFFLVYFSLPAGLRNAWLLVGSLAFYFSGASYAFYVLVLSIPANHYLAHCIANAADPRIRKIALVVGIVLNLAPLLVYKYLAFFVHVANDVSAIGSSPFTLDVPAFLLPAGISFFTFQALSYLADAYTRTIDPARRMTDFGMYHTSFPQLIAGPIVRYVEIASAIESRKLTLASIQWGVTLFCIGLSKKIIIGDNMGSIADRIFALPQDQLLSSVAWLGTLAYTLRDLLRLLRLLRHGDRPRSHARLQVSAELRPTVPLAQHDGILAPLAHDLVTLVPRLPLYPAGWKSRRSSCAPMST